MPEPMYQYFVEGTPIPKPRMTKADVWKKRPCVVEYRAWADAIRLKVCGAPDKYLPCTEPHSIFLVFYLPIPPSTPPAKARRLEGTYHDRRPDIDNLAKGVMDALIDRDSAISALHAEKFFRSTGARIGVGISLVSLHREPEIA